MEIIFLENEPLNIIGFYTDINGCAGCVIKVNPQNTHYEISDSFHTSGVVSLSEQGLKITELAEKYRVTHFLSNSLGEVIYSGGTLKKYYDFGRWLKWEVTEINIEKYFFLFQCYLKEERILFTSHIKETWEKELREFDLEACTHNHKAHHKLFSFFHATSSLKLLLSPLAIKWW